MQLTLHFSRSEFEHFDLDALALLYPTMYVKEMHSCVRH